MQGVAARGGDEIVDQVGRGDEADAEALQAGELADGIGEVILYLSSSVQVEISSDSVRWIA